MDCSWVVCSPSFGCYAHILLLCAEPQKGAAERLASVVSFMEGINVFAQDADSTGRSKSALESFVRELRETIPKTSSAKKEVISFVLSLPALEEGRRRRRADSDSEEDVSPRRRRPYRRAYSPRPPPKQRCGHCKTVGHVEQSCWTKHPTMAPPGWTPKAERRK